MEISQSRIDRQNQIIEDWKEIGHGTLEAATGFGKTYVALMIMERMQEKHPHVSFQIVVPTNFLRKQWKQKVSDFEINNVSIDTVQYLTRNYKKSRYTPKSTLLIADEIHKYGGPQFRKMFKAVKYKYCLGLTATIPEEGEKRDVIERRAPVFARVPLSECREEEWVSKFNVFNLGITLSSEERNEYENLTSQFYKFFSWFDNDFNLAKKVLNDDEVRDEWARSINRDPSSVRGFAAQCFRYMRERKNMLHKLPSKAKVATKIAQKFDKMTVMFGQSTDFADEIVNQINSKFDSPVALPYHSNLDGREVDGEYYSKKDIRKLAISKFSDEDDPIRVLSTAQALDMGADLPEIDIGVIVAGNSSKRQFTQRAGRIIRQREGKHAIIVDIYAINTQDETWLNKRQKGLDRPAQYINSVDEIEI